MSSSNASGPGLGGKRRQWLPLVWWLLLLLILLLVILCYCRIRLHFGIWRLIPVTFVVLVIVFLGYQLR